MKLVIHNAVAVNYINVLLTIVMHSNFSNSIKTILNKTLTNETVYNAFENSLMRKYLDDSQQYIIIEIDDTKLLEIIKVIENYQNTLIHAVNLLSSIHTAWQSLSGFIKTTFNVIEPEIQDMKYDIQDIIEQPSVWHYDTEFDTTIKTNYSSNE